MSLKMMKSAQVRVTVTFKKARPQGYIVNLAPEGGSKIGKWSGSGQINDKDQISFSDVPPGHYVLEGYPNSGSPDEHTKPITIELKGGETTDTKLSAK